MSSIEEVVLSCSREVLEADQLELEDDFMGAGGDSLSAVMLATAVEGELGVELPMHVIFDSASLAEIAQYLVTASASPASS